MIGGAGERVCVRDLCFVRIGVQISQGQGLWRLGRILVDATGCDL